MGVKRHGATIAEGFCQSQRYSAKNTDGPTFKSPHETSELRSLGAHAISLASFLGKVVSYHKGVSCLPSRLHRTFHASSLLGSGPCCLPVPFSPRNHPPSPSLHFNKPKRDMYTLSQKTMAPMTIFQPNGGISRDICSPRTIVNSDMN